MKKLKFFIGGLFVLIGIPTFAQCNIEAGQNQTIVCGGATQLNAETSWSLLNSGITENLNSVYFVNADTGYAVGRNGTIIKTTTGGSSWTMQISNTTQELYSVYFTDANTGYAVGGNWGIYIILKTSNGGNTWSIQTDGTSYNLKSVYFVDANTGYAVGGDDLNYSYVILKTTDGGINWVANYSGTTYCLNSVYFVNTNTGYAVGYNGKVLKTTDAGNTWDTQLSGTNSTLVSIVFTDINNGYAIGGSGTLIKTTNGGTTWNVQTVGDNSYGLTSVYFTDVNTGYVTGNILGSSVIYKTKNGGNSWTVQKSGTPYILNSINFYGTVIGYAVGSAGKIIKLQLPESYLWSPSTGLSEINVANPIANPSVTTTYALTILTPNGCLAKDSVKVSVNPLTVNTGADKSIICGGKVQFDNPITNYTGSGTLTYSWLPSEGLDDATIAQPTAEVTENTTFILTVTTPNGCIAKDTVNVTVESLNVNAGADKTIICGGKVQFDNPITNYTGSGTLTYSWLPSEGLDDATIAQPTAEVTENTTFVLTVIIPNSCIAKDTVKVTVNPLTAIANDIMVSCGNTAQLNVSTNYTGLSSLSYSWAPSLGLSDTNIVNPVATLKTKNKYSVEVKTLSGCSTTTDVNVNPTVIGFNPSICMVTVNENDKNVIVWQRENNTAIDSFYIFRESTNQTNEYNLIGKLPYAASGVFVDTISNARVQSNKYKIATKDVCGFLTDKSAEHKTMHLTINKGIGNKWNLIWEEYVGLTVSSYKIYRGTTKVNLVEIGSSAGGNTTYTDETAPIGNVYYQIGVVLPQACTNLKSSEYESSRSNIMSSTDAVTGISNTLITETFIYPNPAFDKFNVFNTHSANATIMIIDLQGKKVLNKLVGDGLVDISSLSNGIYTVRLIDTGNILINKLVKQ